MISTVDGFKNLTNHLLELNDFFNPGPVRTCFFDWDDKNMMRKLREQIKRGGAELSKEYPYWEDYVEPLVSDELETAVWSLTTDRMDDPGLERPLDPSAYAIMTLLANAAIQPGEPDLSGDVQTLQKFVTEMYESFFTSRKELGAKRNLDHKYPPLVGFIGHLPSHVRFKPHVRIPLPCTLELEQLRQSLLLGPVVGGLFKVGAVGLSAGYRTHPLMWGVLGHELGGHYCLTADRNDKMVTELQDKIYEMLHERYKNSPLEVVAPLWRSWTEEAAADVCAVLNLGPSYAIGAIAFFTALLNLSGYRTTSKLSHQYTNNQYDLHVIPVLVPHLIIGAIEGLKAFAPKKKSHYTQLVAAIGKAYSSNDYGVVFPHYSKVWHPGNIRLAPIDLPLTLPLDEMQAIAKEVGKFIMTVSLDGLDRNALRDHAFAWNDNDEENALTVRNTLMAGTPRSFTTNGKRPTSRHLLAGGLLAVMENHVLYDKVSTALTDAFSGKL
jgi:hypothetical protein